MPRDQAFLWVEKLSGRKYTLFEYVGSRLEALLDSGLVEGGPPQNLEYLGFCIFVDVPGDYV